MIILPCRDHVMAPTTVCENNAATVVQDTFDIGWFTR